MHQDAAHPQEPYEGNALRDVTDHVYHTLSLFEQLAARLEQRCHALDATVAGHGGEQALMAAAVEHLNLGRLQPLLDDAGNCDILINGIHDIYVERGGVLEKVDLQFDSEEELAELAFGIAHSCGRVIDLKHPYVDARLPDGSRVNIVMPPVSIDGVSISIRKFGGASLNLTNMAESGCMSLEMAEFLRCCAKANANMVISGGTGSGKTTLLNAICKHIPETERVITIEDSAELQLPIPHVVRLESIDHDSNGGRVVTIRDLVRNALRMRPNRIIVGESRGAEAFDMIQAMNTGHDGSLTTVHANTPRDGIARIENMIGMAGVNLPTVAIRKQIASAIHFVVQVERGSNGHRHISTISEVVGVEGDIITMQDLFTYRQKQQPDGSTHAEHVWSGVFPRHNKLNQLLRDGGVLKMNL